MSEYVYSRQADYARRYGAVYCVLHGMQHSPICPLCAADRYPPNVAALESTAAADLGAIRDCLHTHSSRIDRAHDAAMSVADQLADQTEAHNTLVAYAESIERFAQSMDARLREAERIILALMERPR